MSDFSKETVIKMASLAKLPLTEEEATQYTSHLQGILSYVTMLNEVDTTGVEPLLQTIDMTNTLEADAPKEPLASPEALLGCTGLPVAYGQLKVPNILS